MVFNPYKELISAIIRIMNKYYERLCLEALNKYLNEADAVDFTELELGLGGEYMLIKAASANQEYLIFADVVMSSEEYYIDKAKELGYQGATKLQLKKKVFEKENLDLIQSGYEASDDRFTTMLDNIMLCQVFEVR